MQKPFAHSYRRMERITLHVDATTKVLLRRAAGVSGLRLAEFVQVAAVARAHRLLSQTMVTYISNGEFCRVLDAIENPPAPTDDLVNALSRST